MDRRVPIESQGFFAFFGLRLNTDALASTVVVPPQVSLLRFAVDDIGILGVEFTIVTVATDNRDPIAIADSGVVIGATFSQLGRVVLGATDNVVERRRIVDVDFVKLGKWQVREIRERLSIVR